MGKQVDVAGCEHEAAAELEGIFSQLDLLMTARLSACSRRGVVATKKMQNVRLLQARDLVSAALVVDQQRKIDAGVFAKHAPVIQIAQTDCRDARTALLKFGLVFAQLRDVLAAEDSTIVAQEDHHRRLALPKRAQQDPASIRVGQNDRRQRFGEHL